MSTKKSQNLSTPESFDFIDFQDLLQPHLDTLLASKIALIHKANEHDDNELIAISISLEMQVLQIQELCQKYSALYTPPKLIN